MTFNIALRIIAEVTIYGVSKDLEIFHKLQAWIGISRKGKHNFGCLRKTQKSVCNIIPNNYFISNLERGLWKTFPTFLIQWECKFKLWSGSKII